MSLTIAVAGYGAGNIHSVFTAVNFLGESAELVQEAGALRDKDALIIPGVGAFGEGMQGLRDNGLVEGAREFAASGRPVLGICLGMQLLFDESEEFGRHEGLGLISGKVVHIPPAAKATGYNYRIPHMGWSDLQRPGGGRWEPGSLLHGVEPGSEVYFVHSYMAVPDDPAHILAYTTYGGNELTAVVGRDNVMGCQFHPEKSRHVGLGILKNFLAMARR